MMIEVEGRGGRRRKITERMGREGEPYKDRKATQPI
jgi:hypothetical protein